MCLKHVMPTTETIRKKTIVLPGRMRYTCHEKDGKWIFGFIKKGDGEALCGVLEDLQENR